jgi:hypothetical protein
MLGFDEIKDDLIIKISDRDKNKCILEKFNLYDDVCVFFNQKIFYNENEKVMIFGRFDDNKYPTRKYPDLPEDMSNWDGFRQEDNLYKLIFDEECKKVKCVYFCITQISHLGLDRKYNFVLAKNYSIKEMLDILDRMY